MKKQLFGLVILTVIFLLSAWWVQRQLLRTVGEPCFAIDDGWCYCIYARNYMSGYGFAYNRGDIPLPIGATSLCWPFFLMPAHYLGGNYVLFAILLSYLFAYLSVVMLFGLALLLYRNTFIAFAAGLLLILSNHYTWSAGNGMSTTFLGFWLLTAMYFHLRYPGRRAQYLCYVFLAAAVFIRPDMILAYWLLAGFDILNHLCRRRLSGPQLGKRLGLLVVIFLAFFTPYAAINYFNWLQTGAPELATFSAVSYYEVGRSPQLRELFATGDVFHYAAYVLRAGPDRFLGITNFYYRENGLLLFGILTGALFWPKLSRHKYQSLFAILSVVIVFPFVRGHLFDILSAGQYDRYLHPLIPLLYLVAVPVFFKRNPLFLLIATASSLWFFYQPLTAKTLLLLVSITIILRFVGKFSWRINITAARAYPLLVIICLATVSLRYWSVGVENYLHYAKNTHNIHVATGKWLNLNTPANALIATFDKEAITYYSERYIVSLGGRTTPEMIKYYLVEDERGMEQYMKEHRVGYFIGTPDFYPYLTALPEYHEVVRFYDPDNIHVWINPMIVYQTGYAEANP